MEKTKEFYTAESGLLPFDPIVLLQDVVKRWLVIVLAAVMVGVGAYIAADMSYKPTYRTNTVFVVTTKGSSTWLSTARVETAGCSISRLVNT